MPRFKGEILRRLRGRFTITDFAAQLCVPRMNLSRWERGVCTPNADALSKLVYKTGIPIGEWFTKRGGRRK